MPISNYLKWLSVIAALFLTSCFPVDDESKPFEMYISPISLTGKPLKAGDEFSLWLDVIVVRPVQKAKMRVIIPKEILVDRYYIETKTDNSKGFNKLDGRFKANENNIYEWEGDLSPDGWSFLWHEWTWNWPVKAKRMSIYMRTKTEGNQWSAPIKGRIELDYKKDEDDRGSIGSIKSGHYVEEFTGTHEAWGRGKK